MRSSHTARHPCAEPHGATGMYTAEHPVRSMGKLHILSEFWSFLRVRKKYWLAPIVIVLMLLSLLIVVTQGSALAPFIYALF